MYDKLLLEKGSGSMKEIDLKELRKIQIEILDDINKFCKKNKINYWIDCGTLLGAVRHSGYIPWDDDIDIGMLREDYDKFLKLYNTNNNRYKLMASELDKNYYFQFGKVVDTKTVLYEPDEETGIKGAVYVDVFVYDNAPDDENKLKKMFDKRDFYNKFRIAQLFPDRYDKSSLKKKILRFFINIYLKFLPKNYYTKKCIANSKKYMHKDTKRVGNFTSDKRMTGDKKIFKSFIELPFEKKKYPAPIGYKDWLKAFYGDYMKLPPKEKRVSEHVFKAYYVGEEDEK